MYQNLIEIIKTPGPLTNKYLNENNLNYYSIIKKCKKHKLVKGGKTDNNKCNIKFVIIGIVIIIAFLYKLYK